MNIADIRRTVLFRLIACWLIVIITISPDGYAQSFALPAPGTMIMPTSAFAPVMIKGLKVHPENPLLFDFIVDTGNPGLSADFRKESQKLIKYFLTALTIKEKDLWVNLSPYEKDRVIADDLGQTGLGADMLAQDYILKQLTASMIYPENDLGKAFWQKVYKQAEEKFGTTDIPVDTFNKVWITADKARVFERATTAYIIGGHLKVMLESDYQSAQEVKDGLTPPRLPEGNESEHDVARQIIREIIIPEIEKEVNEGKNFIQLRQMFYAMILATWYKTALKDALLNQVYSNRGKISEALSDDPDVKDKIYAQYLQAYKKGVFDYIKEDVDAVTQQPLPRKYFSGGVELMNISVENAQSVTAGERAAIEQSDLAMVTTGIGKSGGRSVKPTKAAGKSRGNDYIGDTLHELKALLATQDMPAVILQNGRIDEQISGIIAGMALTWYQADNGLRHYRFGDKDFLQGILRVYLPAEMDIREDKNNAIIALIERFAGETFVPGSLVVTECLHPKESDIKSFFAVKHQDGGYEIGFIKNNTPAHEAGISVFTLESATSENVEILLRKLSKANNHVKFNARSNEDVKLLMKNVLTQQEVVTAHEILTTSSIRAYPSQIRGYSAVRIADGSYTLRIVRNTSSNSNYTAEMWHGMPVSNKKIVVEILEAFDTPDIRAEIELFWQAYDSDPSSGAAVRAWSGLVGKVISNVLGKYTRYWHEKGRNGMRYYRGNRFLDEDLMQRMADVTALPQGIMADRDLLLEGFVDNLHDGLSEQGYVPSSLVIVPVSGHNVVKYLYAVRRDNQYGFGLVTEDYHEYVFAWRDTLAVTDVEAVLQGFNRKDVIGRFEQAISANNNVQVVWQKLVTIAKVVSFDQLIASADVEPDLPPIDPKLILKGQFSGTSALKYFYVELFPDGGSLLGMAVQPLGKALEFFTLQQERMYGLPGRSAAILDAMEEERSVIESLIRQNGPISDLRKKVNKVVKGVVGKVISVNLGREKSIVIEMYPLNKMPVHVQKESIPLGQLVAIPWDIAEFLVVGKPMQNGQEGDPVPLLLVRGVEKDALDAGLRSVRLHVKARLDQLMRLDEEGIKTFKEHVSDSLRKKINVEQRAVVPGRVDSSMKSAAIADVVGGIDLNASGMGMDVVKDGNGVEMLFDQAMAEEFRQGDFTGVQGIILNIVPIHDPLLTLGLK